MKVTTPLLVAAAAASLLLAPALHADKVLIDFEDLSEGFYGIPFTHQGITYHDLNNVSGVFPSGEKFGPQEFDESVVEDATFWYDQFTTWGSADKTLTFGVALVEGDNLSLGRISTVMLDLPKIANFASIDLGYLENGPWGGIEIHLDALMDGRTVGAQSFVIADGGGRDNGAIQTLAINDVDFDQLNIYATFGEEFSLPRIILDDIALNFVDAPGAKLVTVPDPLVAGQKADFILSGATPNTKAFLAYSIKGAGRTFVPFLNVTLDLQQPKQAGTAKETNGKGDVIWTLPLGKNLRGINVWLQAAQFEVTTNVVESTIQ